MKAIELIDYIHKYHLEDVDIYDTDQDGSINFCIWLSPNRSVDYIIHSTEYEVEIMYYYEDIIYINISEEQANAIRKHWGGFNYDRYKFTYNIY